MTAKRYIACDLGAESGRVILGTLDGGKLTLDEVHRFPNGATVVGGTRRWNILRIFEELQQGLRKVADRNVPVASLSVDSWGVDYVFMNDRQPVLALPYQYRDVRTERTYQPALDKAGDQIFAETGIQFMALNTLYQLIADVEDNADLLAIADRFLIIADYLNFLFSGVAKAEASIASTTQIYNPQTGSWSAELIKTFGLPEKLFPEIVPSGTRLGPITAEAANDTGLAGVEVVATCSHDTGAAVAAAPASGDEWAYLSSGTWSLIGVELPKPLINEAVRDANFTNEAGFGGTTRFLKNIVGLWLLQESKRMWAKRGDHIDYAEINRLADEAEPYRSLINPSDPRFMAPDDMLGAIADYCIETGQPAPETVGHYARCILESLALLYGEALAQIERLTGRTINTLHIVGGGSQSKLLNQLSADATGRTVMAGPTEATAIGNVLVQAIAMGDLASLDELREVVGASFEIDRYNPTPNEATKTALSRFARLIK